MKRYPILFIIILGISVCSLILSGCAQKASNPESSLTTDNKASYKELTAKDKRLFRQNQELRKMLKQMQEDQTINQEETNKKFKFLSKTIQLLEYI